MKSSYPSHAFRVVDIDNPTKRKIIETAIDQIVRFGPHGVALSAIREVSGQNNRSAVHYHFGGRAGLMTAVVWHIERRLEPFANESLGGCKRLNVEGGLSLSALIKAMACPISLLFKKDRDGQNCIRVMSHFLHDDSFEHRAVGVDLVNRLIADFLPFAADTLPQRSGQDHAKLLFLCVTQTIEMLTLSLVFQGQHEGDDMRLPEFTETDALTMTSRLFEVAG